MNNEKELEKAEKKYLDPDNYYSKDTYDAMVKADMDED